MAESSPVALPPDSPDVPLADLEDGDGTQSEPIDVPDDLQEEEAVETQEVDAHAENGLKNEGKRREKATFDVTRRPGKTHLPIARVQKVLKADSELPTVAREAVFVIAAATEEFTMRLAAAVERVVQRENRMTAQYKDVLSLSRRDEFVFMDEIIKSIPSMQAKRKVKDLLEDDNDKRKRKKPSPEPNGARPMDRWLGAKSSAEREEDEPPDESELHFTVNEDGTMSMS